MFIKEMEGTLMEVSEAIETRVRYVAWFDYTRRAINELQEGTMLAVPNFASDSSTRRYSILEVGSILPTHYALEGGTRGYPGFVVEAARSAAEDWMNQDVEATEDTTKIRLLAIPTNLEIIEPVSGTPEIGPESNIAMVGSRVRVLDTEYSNLIANNGIDTANEKNLTVIGAMTRDDQVEVLVRIEELFRTHFAVFGFTGVGKSNLLSTIVGKVLNDTDEPLKVVFFDLMSEYTTLLIDQLLDPTKNGRILTVGRNTLPEGLFRYINKLPGMPSLDEATSQLERYNLIPKALVKERPLIREALKKLVDGDVFRFYHEAQSLTVYDLFFTEKYVTWAKGRKAAKFNKRISVITTALSQTSARGQNYTTLHFDPDLAKAIREAIESELNKPENAEFKNDGDFSNHFIKLQELERSTAENFHAGITLDEIVADLNNLEKSSLWIIQAHNSDELRGFAKTLGERIYEERRMLGLIDPLVTFIFDEADEFIRRDASGSYLDSAEIAQTLARRGRKFGLGIGIATQRIRYLDTNIMAQPHTYFISKLPRASDRQAVAEAFGVSEDILSQTFRFKKGQWLLMSHDATGLEAIPIPVQAPDANRRIAKWLNP